jgi:hypothetical protein
VNRNLKRILWAIALCGIVLYIGDSLWTWYRIQQGREAFDTVQVEHYSAVPEKNNKVEYFYDAPESVECVRSLFPHSGDNPCWYVRRSQVQRTDL